MSLRQFWCVGTCDRRCHCSRSSVSLCSTKVRTGWQARMFGDSNQSLTLSIRHFGLRSCTLYCDMGGERSQWHHFGAQSCRSERGMTMGHCPVLPRLLDGPHRQQVYGKPPQSMRVALHWRRLPMRCLAATSQLVKAKPNSKYGVSMRQDDIAGSVMTDGKALHHFQGLAVGGRPAYGERSE